MKKKFLFILALMPLSAYPQELITAKSGRVNIRNIPSTKDIATDKTQVLGQITDSKMYAVEENKTDSEGKVWYKINEGWVAGWLVTEVKKISIHGDTNLSNDNSTNENPNIVDEQVFDAGSQEDIPNSQDVQNDSADFINNNDNVENNNEEGFRSANLDEEDTSDQSPNIEDFQSGDNVNIDDESYE